MLSGFRVPVVVGCTKTVAENRVIDSSGFVPIVCADDSLLCCMLVMYMYIFIQSLLLLLHHLCNMCPCRMQLICSI